MSPNHSDTCAPNSELELQNWIRTAEMAGSPQSVTHPRSRHLALSRRSHRVRRLRAPRRVGWLLAVLAHATSLVDHAATALHWHFSAPTDSVIASEDGGSQ
jgi:hypothetical protein